MGHHDLFHSVSDALQANGFEPKKKKGSGHYFFVKEGRKISVPHTLHDRGMARTILKQAGLQPQGLVP